MEKQLYKEEYLYSIGESHLCGETYRGIQAAIGSNHAVGFVAGYYDETLSIAYVSEFFLRNLGYSCEEFMKETAGSLRNVIYGENNVFLKNERFEELHGYGEAQMLTREGVPVNIQAYKSDTVDSEGKKLWIFSAHMDIMRDNLKLVNRVLHSGFWSIDFDKKGEPERVLFSHEFREMLGYHDILDFPNRLDVWEASLHPGDRERVVKQFYEAYSDQTDENKYNVEYRMRLADGSYRWFRDSAEMTRRADGTAFRMAGIFVNIDREKKANMLLEGTTRLVDRYAACNLREGTYQFFSQNNGDAPYAPAGRYEDFITAIVTEFRSISEEISLEEAFSVDRIQKKLKKPEDIYRFEYCKLDETQFKSIAISPLSWNGNQVESVLFMAQDTTAEKLMEIASRKALKEAYEAANRASRAKTEFLSNMSHDIRTPMNAIIGMTAIAGANIENQDRVVDCLGKITQSSRHLLSLVNEVLDMSRIESGKIALLEEEFNLSDLCDNLVTMTKAQTDMHRHQFEVHINQIEHEDVCGDSMRIQQLITNILSNAVKYTSDGGRIDFSMTELPTGSRGVGCYEFTVEDNGMGMSKEFQKVIFEPFTRADDLRTTKIQGTGLGMAIARNFARMMNGDIRIESEPGKGSKFTVTIFLKLQNKEIGPVEELVNLPVLVVDDDRNCCENTVSMLEEIGIDGEWVTSGQEAVERVAERYKQDENYFAIILDWKMPGMDGIETTRRIRKQVGRDVTIIVLSAYDYAEIEQEAREAGVDEFIAKPLFRSRLTATLKNIIEGKPNNAARHYLSEISGCDYRGKRVLLVEDNDLNREIAQEILEMTGAQVVTVENGKSAVELLASEQEHFDLIFMDIQMPIMNGYEATAAIRSLHRTDAKTLPIVAMTANAFAEDVMLAKSAGMNEHISKPIDMVRLRDVMRKWL